MYYLPSHIEFYMILFELTSIIHCTDPSHCQTQLAIISYSLARHIKKKKFNTPKFKFRISYNYFRANVKTRAKRHDDRVRVFLSRHWKSKHVWQKIYQPLRIRKDLILLLRTVETPLTDVNKTQIPKSYYIFKENKTVRSKTSTTKSRL